MRKAEDATGVDGFEICFVKNVITSDNAKPNFFDTKVQVEVFIDDLPPAHTIPS
jgi:hypothetical protein